MIITYRKVIIDSRSTWLINSTIWIGLFNISQIFLEIGRIVIKLSLETKRIAPFIIHQKLWQTGIRAVFIGHTRIKRLEVFNFEERFQSRNTILIVQFPCTAQV